MSINNRNMEAEMTINETDSILNLPKCRHAGSEDVAGNAGLRKLGCGRRQNGRRWKTKRCSLARCVAIIDQGREETRVLVCC